MYVCIYVCACVDIYAHVCDYFTISVYFHVYVRVRVCFSILFVPTVQRPLKIFYLLKQHLLTDVDFDYHKFSYIRCICCTFFISINSKKIISLVLLVLFCRYYFLPRIKKRLFRFAFLMFHIML